MDAWRGNPSRRLLLSIKSRTCSSDSYAARKSGFIFNALSIVIPISRGTILAMESTMA